MEKTIAKSRKYLIIGPSWVGDMVMSQSLYQRLNTLYPDVQIDVLAPAWCHPILERMPEVTHAIKMPIGHGELAFRERWNIAKKLKTHAYTHAIILPNSAKSALIPWFAGIANRTGWKGEMRYGLLTDLRPCKTDFQYMVERYVALAHDKHTMCQAVTLSNCSTPQLRIDKENQDTSLISFAIDKNKALVGLCPGAEFGPAKRWPDEYYADVAQTLIDQGHQIALFGSHKDASVTARIVDNLSKYAQTYCFDLAGKTTLNDAVDLLAACHTVISNDSGLMHVAAAVNTKIIAIYGSSSPQYTPPLAKQIKIVDHFIECRPCFKRECPLGHLKCLKYLPVSQVLDAFDALN